MRAVMPVLPGLARVPDICNVQEGRPFEADIDKGGLHARQNADNFTQIDIPDPAPRERALDMQFLDRGLLNEGDPGFLGGDINQDFFVHRASKCNTGSAQQRCSFK